MNSKRIIAFVVCVAFALALMVGCNAGPAVSSSKTAAPPAPVPTPGPASQPAAAAPAPKQPVNYIYAGAAAGGSAYVYAAAIADVVTRNVDYVTMTVESMGSTEAQLELLEAGDVDFSGGTNVLNYQAMYGVGWSDGKPKTKSRIFGPRETGGVHFVTMAKNNDINKIQDIQGKRVGFGPAGGTIDSIGREIFEALGIKPAMIQNASWSDCFDAMQDGNLDMMWINTIVPFPALMEFETSAEVKYLTMSKEDIQKIVAKYPWHTSGTIPGSRYKYEDKDWETLVSIFVTTASVDVPQDIAYDIIKAIWENKQDIVSVSANFANAKPEDVLKIGLPIHAGTVQYLKEIGVEVPAALIPPEYVAAG